MTSTHERCFAQQFTSMYQVSDCHVKIGVTTAPVGDLCKRMYGQYVLKHQPLRTGCAANIIEIDYMWLKLKTKLKKNYMKSDLGDWMNKVDSMLVDCY